ncbi:hypothetical protein RUM43_000423 [Polyplax serrata]|uniref:Uncharacterized protein n=1 Tax=Polyplax serrata TaxID=468196 RepID=A0AAN8XQD7_POLSC
MAILLSLDVLWFQQQHEKKRKKRDYIEPDFSNFGGFPFYTASPPLRSQFLPHFQTYRGIGPNNLFPDPLFREQWYLIRNFLDSV